MSEEAKDPLKPFRELFGKPVLVQTAMQVAYLSVGPKADRQGTPLLVQLPNDSVVGVSEFIGRAENALVGMLRANEDGSMLVLEQLCSIDATERYQGGRARMDVYIRPEAVAFVTFVKAIEDAEIPPRLLA